MNCAILANTTLEGSFFQMNSCVMPLKGEFIGSSIITNRTLMVSLRVFLMNISYVSFESAFVNSMIVTGFTGELCLETLLVNFTFVSLQRRGVASFVITAQALVELDFFVDRLSVSVQSVLVE